MWADARGGENYCGNLLWQSGLTLLSPDEHRRRRSFAAAGFGVPARSAICKASQKKALHISTCLFDAAAPASIRHFAVFCAWPKNKKGGYVSYDRNLTEGSGIW
jgi:hypothetical protein